MKKIIWSPKAIISLEQIVNFIDNKWEKKIGDQLLDRVDHTIKLISQFPEMFPLFSKRRKIRRCVINKKTLLFYRIRLTEIDILQFADARQNPKKYEF